jgi:hypothetical protein
MALDEYASTNVYKKAYGTASKPKNARKYIKLCYTYSKRPTCFSQSCDHLERRALQSVHRNIAKFWKKMRT